METLSLTNKVLLDILSTSRRETLNQFVTDNALHADIVRLQDYDVILNERMLLFFNQSKLDMLKTTINYNIDEINKEIVFKTLSTFCFNVQLPFSEAGLNEQKQKDETVFNVLNNRNLTIKEKIDELDKYFAIRERKYDNLKKKCLNE